MNSTQQPLSLPRHVTRPKPGYEAYAMSIVQEQFMRCAAPNALGPAYGRLLESDRNRRLIDAIKQMYGPRARAIGPLIQKDPMRFQQLEIDYLFYAHADQVDYTKLRGTLVPGPVAQIEPIPWGLDIVTFNQATLNELDQYVFEPAYHHGDDGNEAPNEMEPIDMTSLSPIDILRPTGQFADSSRILTNPGEICVLATPEKIREKLWQLEKDVAAILLRRLFQQRAVPGNHALSVRTVRKWLESG